MHRCELLKVSAAAPWGNVYRMDRMLTALNLAGVLAKIRGLLPPGTPIEIDAARATIRMLAPAVA